MRTKHCVLIALTLSLILACGSNSSDSSTEADPVLDISADSMAFVLDSDTLVAYWSETRLVVDTDTDLEGDSLAFYWRTTESNEDWKLLGTQSLAQLPLQINVSFSSTVTADFRLVHIAADGKRITADSACAALVGRKFYGSSSSSSTSSSSSQAPTSSSSSATGFDITLSNGTWKGSYSTATRKGTYSLKLETSSYTESFSDSCLEYTGSWSQKYGTLTLTPTKRTRYQSTDTGCTNLADTTANLSGTPVPYPLTIMSEDGTTLYLEITGLGALTLDKE